MTYGDDYSEIAQNAPESRDGTLVMPRDFLRTKRIVVLRKPNGHACVATRTRNKMLKKGWEEGMETLLRERTLGSFVTLVWKVNG